MVECALFEEQSWCHTCRLPASSIRYIAYRDIHPFPPSADLPSDPLEWTPPPHELAVQRMKEITCIHPESTTRTSRFHHKFCNLCILDLTGRGHEISVGYVGYKWLTCYARQSPQKGKTRQGCMAAKDMGEKMEAFTIYPQYAGSATSKLEPLCTDFGDLGGSAGLRVVGAGQRIPLWP